MLKHPLKEIVTIFSVIVTADQEGEISVESLQLEFSTIKGTTENFSPANKLGEGKVQTNSRQILLVAKLQHRNLVKLFGFCLAREEKLLVYEFVPNGSLDQFLFDPKKRAHLDWETRNKIIVGVARGLQYLHEDSRLKVLYTET
ncbi:hypothetical protein VitviT2T_014519 [Vitis vinifera]|uniref:Protein kinase domain-containing protein n=1 Tax=Vitis vinifera TaxID=29760 RepID=A0ABY9CK35_VITVI|nr:hypothetical protein VitviT2T_014519 [Vitis vinifera]